MKARLLLTSILFLFAQIPTMQAQETLDFAKITCDQFVLEELATPSRDIGIGGQQYSRLHHHCDGMDEWRGFFPAHQWQRYDV